MKKILIISFLACLFLSSCQITSKKSDSIISSTTIPSTTIPSTTIPSTTTPSTTIPSTTTPSTTIPSTTTPSTTIPSTTTPSTTIPSTTIPSTTIPSTTIPSTTIPSTTIPSTTTPSTTDSTDSKEEMTLDKLFDGASISDIEFIDFYKNLGDYNNSAQIVNNSIYASPNGNGDGTKSSPYSLEDALEKLKPGDTLYLREGIYIPPTNEGFFINKSGTSSNYITIRNYPGEHVVITNSSTKSEVYGFEIEANTSYVIIEGLEICNITAYNAFGIAVWGNNQNHLIIRNNSIHDIKTTAIDSDDSDSSANGILFNGENKKSINNIIVSNNHIYNNHTGWAESLSIAGNCEYFYVLNNLVENNTNIGIDFYGNAGYCNVASLDQPRYSLAAGNFIKKSVCSYADCAGLYVDGARDILLQYNEISDSLYGIEIGSEEKQVDYPVKNIVVRYNRCINNNLSIRIGGYEEKNTGVVTSTEIYNNTFISNYDDYQMIIAKSDGITIKDNLFYCESKNIVQLEFSEEYIKNISFINNTFYSKNKTKDEVIFTIYNISFTFEEFIFKYGFNLYEEFIVE
ncbi:MAG: right-handed parallel beta-helix repeat-containing protein [Anaeroplasma sp.]